MLHSHKHYFNFLRIVSEVWHLAIINLWKSNFVLSLYSLGGEEDREIEKMAEAMVAESGEFELQAVEDDEPDSSTIPPKMTNSARQTHATEDFDPEQEAELERMAERMIMESDIY